jgi:hypothetical protein
MIMFFILLTHAPSVNPGRLPISVDTTYYQDFLADASTRGVIAALDSQEIQARPLYLIGIYRLWKILPVSPYFLMDIVHPFVSLTLISVASYYTASRIGDQASPGIVSIMVPFGYIATGFLAGGFHSNCLALSPAILSLALEPEKSKDLVILTLLWIIVGVLHPWTHLMYIGAQMIYSLQYRKRLVKVFQAGLLSLVIVNAVGYLFIPGQASVIAVKAASGNLGFYLYSSLLSASRFWVWNSLSNPLYVCFSAIPSCGLVSAFISTLLPFGLFSPGFLIYRIMLNLPLHLETWRSLRGLKVEHVSLLLLVFLVRVLGNLTGLTPITS